MPTLRSLTLEQWSRLPPADRLALRRIAVDALSLDRERRLDWLRSQKVSDDHRRLLERLLSCEGLSLSDVHEAFLTHLADQPAALPGDRFDDWTIVRPIGQGGMGEVYLAQRMARDFEQLAALKLLPRSMTNEDAQRRFGSEIRFLAKLGRLIDGGVASDGRQFLVMEYASEGALLAFCNQRRIGIRQRVEFFCELCESVQHLHAEGLVHCDIKPENVLMGADGKIHLIDLSIAQGLGGRRTAGGIRSRAHTPFFGAPEQKDGRSEVTVGADIHGLGRLLAVLLIGGLATRAAKRGLPLAAVLDRDDPLAEKVASDRGVTIDELRIDLEHHIDRIVTRATMPDPGARYPSVNDLRRDALQFKYSLPNVALTARDLWRRLWRRQPAMLLALATLLLSLGIALGWFGGRTIDRRSIQGANRLKRDVERLEWIFGLENRF